jgi:acyl-CoA thioester hydrolase
MTAGNQFETFRGLVYPAHCDAMGHMNVQHYVAAFDQAMWHLVHEIGYRRPASPGTGHGRADVRHVIEYRRELAAGALYRILSGVAKVGRSSVVTIHRMFALETGELAAECEMTSVFFDLSARESCPLPQPLRDAAMALLSPRAAT